MDNFTALWQTKIQNLQSTLEKSEIADRFDPTDVTEIGMQFFDESSIAPNGSDTIIGMPISLESISSSDEKILKIINYRDYQECERPECHSCKLVQSDMRNTKGTSLTNGCETFRTDGSNLKKKTSTRDEVQHHMQKYLSKQQIEKQKTDARRRCFQNLQYELEGNSQRVFFLLKELEDLI